MEEPADTFGSDPEKSQSSYENSPGTKRGHLRWYSAIGITRAVFIYTINSSDRQYLLCVQKNDKSI